MRCWGSADENNNVRQAKLRVVPLQPLTWPCSPLRKRCAIGTKLMNSGRGLPDGNVIIAIVIITSR
eukprot:scaffold228579_cov17-Tisochrysis_lutea.AAC.1